MSLNKNKNKNKNKSYTKAGTVFPANGWDPEMEALAELPNFFEIRGWRDNLIDPPPGPDETAEELRELLYKQEELRKSPEWLVRKPEIELEAKEDCPYLRRLLMPTPSGSFAGTEVLIRAMFGLGSIVGTYYKKKFMRPRPSQLEPRLRPIIDVPGWSAYPSGHGLQYFLVAKALATVVHSDELGNELFKIARRVAENREWAGLHFKSDTKAGERLAFAIFPNVTDAFRETFQSAAREWI
jgi:hypothetical protein